MSGQERIVAVKKVSLEGLSEGYGPECYAYVRPATFEDNIEASEMDTEKMKGRAGVEWQKNFVNERFISGKIEAFNGTDFELVDMKPEDAHVTPDISNALYYGIMGIDVDPKAIREAAEKSASQTNEEATTGTASSENSQSPSTLPTS